jgi:mono/diheme cytochrome c family protein
MLHSIGRALAGVMGRVSLAVAGRAPLAVGGGASFAVLACVLAASAAAQSVTPAELGKREFESSCASCHGMDAQGDGPMRPFLVRPPTDLTTLARRNGGVYPKSVVADLIDGRGVTGPGPHGTRDMPVWGRIYREQSEYQTRGTPIPPEWSVRGRIYALVEYLGTVQQR